MDSTIHETAKANSLLMQKELELEKAQAEIEDLVAALDKEQETDTWLKYLKANDWVIVLVIWVTAALLG